jgi:hypothetical protein
MGCETGLANSERVDTENLGKRFNTTIEWLKTPVDQDVFALWTAPGPRQWGSLVLPGTGGGSVTGAVPERGNQCRRGINHDAGLAEVIGNWVSKTG